MRTLAVALVCLTALVHGLYEEPPGGCQGPVDDEPFPQARVQRKARPTQQPPPPPPPPPPPADPDAELEELERQLYERESAAQLAGLGADDDDWAAIEKSHLRDQRNRELLSTLVVVLGVLFAAYKVLTHVREQQAPPPAKDGAGAKQAAAAEPKAEPTAAASKAEPTNDAAAPAADASVAAQREAAARRS
jgi:colicin import membrane protein